MRPLVTMEARESLGRSMRVPPLLSRRPNGLGPWRPGLDHAGARDLLEASPACHPEVLSAAALRVRPPARRWPRRHRTLCLRHVPRLLGMSSRVLRAPQPWPSASPKSPVVTSQPRPLSNAVRCPKKTPQHARCTSCIMRGFLDGVTSGKR